MDAGLDQNETELGVLVLAVGLKVLADRDRLFDKVPEILGDLGRKTCIVFDKPSVAFLPTTPRLQQPEKTRYAPFDFRIRRILLPVTKRT